MQANTAVPLSQDGSKKQTPTETPAAAQTQFKPAITNLTGTATAPVYTSRPEPSIKKRTWLKSQFRTIREGKNLATLTRDFVNLLITLLRGKIVISR